MTTEKFEAYESVRKSGLTNMWDVNMVIKLAYEFTGTRLDRVDVLDIIKNYDGYQDTYAEKYRDME